MSVSRKLLNYLVFIMAAQASFPALAAEGAWAQADFLKARLLTEKTASGNEATLNAGLDIAMEPEWHIYWRMPGDGGLPPVLDWSKSTNLKDAKILWPAPRRFEYEGLYGFGYKDAALLPLTLTPVEPGKAINLVLHADIMVCKELCVPQALDMMLEIPAGTATADAQADLLGKAFKSLPYTEDRGDMKIENVVLGPKAIVVRAYLGQGFEGADLFAEIGPDFYLVAKPEITPDEKDTRYASMVIAAPEGVDNLATAIMGKKLVLTLTNKKGQALERSFDF